MTILTKIFAIDLAGRNTKRLFMLMTVSSSEEDVAVSDEVESPPSTKKMHYSMKHESDSSDSDGSGKSSGSRGF